MFNTSTHGMWALQELGVACEHPAIRKWEELLQERLPDTIWQDTWMPFPAARENAILWQILFWALATLAWSFLNRPRMDPTLWCPRYNKGNREDIFHLIWQCPCSACWRWCAKVLSLASTSTQQFVIEPSHIILAALIPDD